jgi:hypothetical protein
LEEPLRPGRKNQKGGKPQEPEAARQEAEKPKDSGVVVRWFDSFESGHCGTDHRNGRNLSACMRFGRGQYQGL